MRNEATNGGREGGRESKRGRCVIITTLLMVRDDMSC